MRGKQLAHQSLGIDRRFSTYGCSLPTPELVEARDTSSPMGESCQEQLPLAVF